MAIKFRFTGEEGSFLPGIPARDLSDEDLAELSAEQRGGLDQHMRLDQGRIYEATPVAATKPARQAEEEV
jgi:hypothetical protein